MRTTLDIEDSVLSAVKELAYREGRTAGDVISELARKAMLQGTYATSRLQADIAEPPPSYGFSPLPANGIVVTNALVDKLRDDLGV